MALLYSLIPLILNLEYMQEKGISLFLMLLNAPAVGIYAMADWYYPEYFIAKIICILISTIFMWLLFLVLWKNRIYRKRTK